MAISSQLCLFAPICWEKPFETGELVGPQNITLSKCSLNSSGSQNDFLHLYRNVIDCNVNLIRICYIMYTLLWTFFYISGVGFIHVARLPISHTWLGSKFRHRAPHFGFVDVSYRVHIKYSNSNDSPTSPCIIGMFRKHFIPNEIPLKSLNGNSDFQITAKYQWRSLLFSFHIIAFSHCFRICFRKCGNFLSMFTHGKLSNTRRVKVRFHFSFSSWQYRYAWIFFWILCSLKPFECILITSWFLLLFVHHLHSCCQLLVPRMPLFSQLDASQFSIWYESSIVLF